MRRSLVFQDAWIEGEIKGRREGIELMGAVLDRRSQFPNESYEETAKAVGCSAEEVRMIAERVPRTWEK